jgi:hypothetical protein
MLDRREEAWKLLEEAPEMVVNKGSKFTKFALNKIGRILKTRSAPFLALDLLFLRRDLAHMEPHSLLRALLILDTRVMEVGTHLLLLFPFPPRAVLKKFMITLFVSLGAFGCRFPRRTRTTWGSSTSSRAPSSS